MIRRFLATLSVLLVMVLAVGCTATPAPPANEYLDGFNYVRNTRGVAPLVYDYRLEGMARDWATWLCGTGFFYHRDMIATMLSDQYGWYSKLGEVIARGTADFTFSEVLTAWVESPPHLAEIVDPAYNGVGVAKVPCGALDVWVANLARY
jgi:uncharacterized protein YkwD